MDWMLVVKGVFIGLAIGVPIGPIGVLCIQRTLSKGREHGLLSGLGAATAAALYGFIAAFGLLFVQDFILRYHGWFRPLGFLALLALGLKIFFTRPVLHAVPINGIGLLRAYTSAFIITLTNPFTIIAFAIVFVGLGVAAISGSLYHAGLLVLGIFCGSAAWWILISGSVGLFHGRLNLQELRWINRIAGSILIVFALIVLFGIRS